MSRLTVGHLLDVAAAEVGYLEKRNGSQLDDKTANAGANNYTKYGRDMHRIQPRNMDYPAAWCDCFVDWCMWRAAGKDAKKAKTEEEKAAIMAEAEAKMTPAPEMIALPAAEEEAAAESAGEADKAEGTGDGATPADAEKAGPKPDGKTPEAEQEEPEEEKPDYLTALLTGGLYIENPVTEEAEQEREEKAAKEVPLATRPNALLPDDPEEKPESGTPSDADRTPVTVTMAENEIHIPLLEADPGFELGYGFDYVEVDIGRQHVTLFENCRKVMESDCVTGIPNKARATHPGVFKIDYKQRNRILRGSQNSSSPSHT